MGELIIIEPEAAPHIPTQESRLKVTRWVACGLDNVEIAFMLKLDLVQLRQHYSDELAHGTAYWVGEVGNSLIERGLAGDVKAAETFLRARGRWTFPTKQEADTQASKEQLAERKRLMDSIMSHVQPKTEVAVTQQGAGVAQSRRSATTRGEK